MDAPMIDDDNIDGEDTEIKTSSTTAVVAQKKQPEL
jgi:hypothetical protein